MSRTSLGVAAVTATAAALLSLGAPTAAAAPTSFDGVRADGYAVVGTAPQNRCTATYVREDISQLKGYRVGARCEQLADFTKARGSNDYPVQNWVTTEWFTDLDSVHGSEWKPRTRFVSPHIVVMDYGATERGVRMYAARNQLAYSVGLDVTLATAPDEDGSVAVYWAKSASEAVELVRGRPADGRTELTIPGGTIPAGQQQVFAVLFDADGEPRHKTKPLMLTITKVPGTLDLRASTHRVALDRGFDLAMALPRTATGTVTVTDVDEDRVVASAEAGDGRASLHGLRLPPGTHTLVATYDGDQSHLPATSDPVTVQVLEVELEATSTAPRSGERVGLTATVPEGATGHVRFRLEGARWKATSAPVAVRDGVAEHALDPVPSDRGPFKVYAEYLGDSHFPSITSRPVDVTVGP